MKILIHGHARHGKDTLAEIWAEHYGFKYEGSSQAANRLFMFDKLAPVYGYATPEECFEDRVNHRKEWFDAIEAFNTPDAGRLAQHIVDSGNSYVGMRSFREFRASVLKFDLIIWVDASDRLPPEDESSFDIPRWAADIVIENNQGIDEFKCKALVLGKAILGGAK